MEQAAENHGRISDSTVTESDFPPLVMAVEGSRQAHDLQTAYGTLNVKTKDHHIYLLPH